MAGASPAYYLTPSLETHCKQCRVICSGNCIPQRSGATPDLSAPAFPTSEPMSDDVNWFDPAAAADQKAKSTVSDRINA
jgi:hypothetical protein